MLQENANHHTITPQEIAEIVQNLSTPNIGVVGIVEVTHFWAANFKCWWVINPHNYFHITAGYDRDERSKIYAEDSWRTSRDRGEDNRRTSRDRGTH